MTELHDDVAATLRFFMEADRLKGVERKNFLADGSRRENTAEHSWHLGIAAMIMAPFASEPVDIATAVCMALVHDIVEIDAGDTFAYSQSEEEVASKESREIAAADHLFGLLPTAMGERFRALWDEYERGDTPEARYVMAVDRMAPMLLNTAEGGSTWREYGITRERVIARNGSHIEKALPAIWASALAGLDAATAAGHVAAD
ncbi:MAG TPA: HD domain-containing protein [Ilumatobacteraceae bacterium]|nr:HD domain-containing protein [Ilumatobacteraceae bacterium]HRB04773.1 HD domain-containing protein [Ilumatobacteraceae bacterium]